MSDFGAWKCKAMLWYDWTEAEINVKRFEEGSIEFKEVFGDVTAEAGKIFIDSWKYHQNEMF